MWEALGLAEPRLRGGMLWAAVPVRNAAWILDHGQQRSVRPRRSGVICGHDGMTFSLKQQGGTRPKAGGHVLVDEERIGLLRQIFPNAACKSIGAVNSGCSAAHDLQTLPSSGHPSGFGPITAPGRVGMLGS